MTLVVAVALWREDGMVLLQQRRADRQHGGLWEFPGGKVELGESPPAAAIREIAEELAITLLQDSLEPISFASSAASDRPLTILLYLCRAWKGTPQCLDAAQIRWVAPAAISALPMPPLDYPLARALLRHTQG